MTEARASPEPRTIAVVGAGIVGVSAALFLQRDGHRVILIDREGPAAGASYGNAGGLVTTACLPLAMPGILARVPRMLLDPDGPLRIGWTHLPRAAPFLLKFLRNSAPDRVARSADGLAALNSRAEDPWRDLARQAGIAELLRMGGWLKVYETDAGFAASQAERDLMTGRGHRFEVLNADELRQLEPGLAPIFKYGYLQPDGPYLANPGRAVTAFAENFVARGGRLEIEEVTGFETAAKPLRVRTASGREISADALVLATGAWSRPLARQLGIEVRLEAEAGYHLMLPPAEPGLRRPTVNAEHHFILSPMEQGTRLAAQSEFRGLAAAPDFRRVRRLLAVAKRMLPALETREMSAWRGFRPSLPDSLPLITAAPGRSDIFLGFGGSHYGLTQGPLTGRILADLVAGRDPGLDLTPYTKSRR